jgi:putative intracellular protease/amidase
MKKVFEAIMEAFADCHMDDMDKAFSLRNLDFKAEHSISLEALTAILPKAIPTGYNDFDAAHVCKVLADAKVDCMFTVAREGSPCLWVHGSDKELTRVSRLVAKLRADSATKQEGALRIWWD